MEQKITYFVGKIESKFYLNNRGQYHGLYEFYHYGKINYKTNYINGRKYGFETMYTVNSKIYKHIYHL